MQLLYRNGQRRDLLLAGIPRQGERVVLDNGRDEPALVVDLVTWVEGKGRTPDPEVILSVHKADE